MIDFQNASFFKLKPVSDKEFENMIRPMFINGEEIIQSYRGIRDGVVFTNKRIFAINVQGLTGKKKTLHPSHTAKFRHTASKPPVFWIWTVNWNYGSPAWARSNLNLLPRQMFLPSAA